MHNPAGWINTDLPKRCFARQCSLQKILLLLLHCQCGKPWKECQLKSGHGLVCFAHSIGQCEDQLERNKKGMVEYTLPAIINDHRLPRKHETSYDKRMNKNKHIFSGQAVVHQAKIVLNSRCWL